MFISKYEPSSYVYAEVGVVREYKSPIELLQGSCALKQKTIHERKMGKEKKLDTLSSIDPLYQTIESLTALDGVQTLFHLESSGLLF